MKWLALLLTIVLIAGCIGQTVEAPGTQAAPPGEEPAQEAPQETAPSPPTLGLSVTDAPTTVTAGTRLPITWQITSPDAKSTKKTVIYYGIFSRAGDVATSVTPDALDYDKVTPTQKGDVPGTFTEYVTTGDNPGKLYFRAYAQIDELNYWSDEYVIEIVAKPKITITESPESVGKTSTFQVKWDVEDGYPGKIDKTYIMWGIRSGQYTDFSSEQAGNTPGSFEGTVTAPGTVPETLYFLVTATVDGKAYNTTENKVTIY